MIQQVWMMIVLLIVIANIVVWGICVFFLLYIKKQKNSNEVITRLTGLNDSYQISARLHNDFRVIRHDFANYVQAILALDDEESREMLKKQKLALRQLVKEWNNCAENNFPENEGI